MSQESIANIFRAFRSDFNFRFESARAQFPKLESQKFLECIRCLVYPAANNVSKHSPEDLSAVLNALFDACLELSGQEIFEKYPAVAKAWQLILPLIPQLLIINPEKVIRVLSNAAYNMNLHSTADWSRWLSTMSKLGPDYSDLDAFFELGQCASWICGLAQFRSEGLKIAKNMTPKVLGTCFEIELTSESQQSEILHRMNSDPWLKPEEAIKKDKASKELKIVARLGGFRGYGGFFLTPPLLSMQNENLVAYDFKNAWMILADCFGAHFQRIPTEQVAAADNQNINFSKNGQLYFKNSNAEFPELNPIRATLALEHTLAVVSANSHHIFLLGEI